jgi:flagellar biosynthesis/type III secretory pathway M-ring protein FliF/YscJ
MDLLHKAYGQLADLLRSMTPSARLTSALLLVVIAVSLGWLVQGGIGESETWLMDGQVFSPSQLRDMQAAFGKAGLEAHVDGAQVRVPRGQESKYMAALAEAHALPIEFGGYLHKAVAGDAFMPMFRNQHEAALRVAKQQELQLIIGNMSGIDKAAVQIDHARSEGFPPKDIITAAVMVQPKTNHELEPSTARVIRQMVASCVAGLEPEAITVVDLSSHRSLPAGGADAGTDGSLDGESDYKRRQEADWQQKIGHVLEFIPGVLVSTNVELDADGGARAVRSVKASVAVPQAYYEQVWRTEHPTFGVRKPNADALAETIAREKTKIEHLVANLLPSGGQLESQQLVAVSTFHPLDTSTDFEFRARALAWVGQNWTTLALGGLTVLGLLILRSMVRSVPPARLAAEIEVARELDDDVSFASQQHFVDPPEASVPPRPKRRAAVGPALQGELADIVRDDPDAAASVLRTWIGNAN